MAATSGYLMLALVYGVITVAVLIVIATVVLLAVVEVRRRRLKGDLPPPTDGHRH